MKNFKRILAMVATLLMIAAVMATPAFATQDTSCFNTTVTADAAAKALRTTSDSISCNADDEFRYATSYKGITLYSKERLNVDSVVVTMNENGGIDITGMDTGSETSWNNLFSRYRTVIVGISGIGAITMIAFFIINFMKLGSSAGNPQARSQALTGVLWTGLAAAGLGAVSIIAGFFYNAV